MSYFADEQITLHHGDSLAVLRTLPDASVDCCVTSPPYFGLRDYGTDGQYGLEASPAEYVETMRALFAEVRRVLADDGTLWLNIGDSYSGAGPSGASYQSETTRRRAAGDGMDGKFRVSKRLAERDLDYSRKKPKPKGGIPSKNLFGIPWRVALALQDDDWILRNGIIWNKPSCMPESAKTRLSRKHEFVFLLAKNPDYWFDLDAIKEPPSAMRPQRRRAQELAAERGLTEAHLSAIRSVGVADVGKALTVTDGAGKNRGDVIALADEAKRLLGGYYREFLTAESSNPGDVWTISMAPFSEAHFAVMPAELAERCILAGCKPGGTVLDPFSGSGTTGLAANKHGRKYVGIDLNADYLDLSLRTRFAEPGFNFGEVGA